MRRLVAIGTMLVLGAGPGVGTSFAGPDTAATPFNELRGVDALAADDVWAVGIGGVPGDYRTVARHWDGLTWTRFHTPSPCGDAGLNAVAMVATDDVWAVGDEPFCGRNIVLHWDGTVWTNVDVPQPPGRYNRLDEVSVISADDVLAGGTFCMSGEGPCFNQTMRWDGHEWTWQQSGRVTSVQMADAQSPTNAWGLGTANYRDGQPVVQRWDGSRWRPTEVPDTTFGARPASVSMVSSEDAWVAGALLTREGWPQGGGWLLHWDGSTWTESDPGSPTLLDIRDISADRGDNAWLVGRNLVTSAFTRHWDGEVWQDVPTPSPDAYLADVESISPRDAWTVGSIRREAGLFAVVIHWNGSKWKRIPLGPRDVGG